MRDGERQVLTRWEMPHAHGMGIDSSGNIYVGRTKELRVDKYAQSALTGMRIVLIGVSHWHTPFYSEPVLAMTDATIVGVSDPDAARAAPLAAQGEMPRLHRLSRDVREAEARLRFRARPPQRHGR